MHSSSSFKVFKMKYSPKGSYPRNLPWKRNPSFEFPFINLGKVLRFFLSLLLLPRMLQLCWIKSWA